MPPRLFVSVSPSRSGKGDGGLNAGPAYIWVCVLSSSFNIDSFAMSGSEVVSSPYGGVPAAVPGVIEAEEFDTGGAMLAYYDTNTANKGEVGHARLKLLAVLLVEDKNNG